MTLHLPPGAAQNAQQTAAIAQMRLGLAAEVLKHLAAIDFNRAVLESQVKAQRERERYGVADEADEPDSEDYALTINPGPVAAVAREYADALLCELGILHRREDSGGAEATR